MAETGSVPAARHDRHPFGLGLLLGGVVTFVTASTGVLSVDGVKETICQWRADRVWEEDKNSADGYRDSLFGCGEEFAVVTIPGAENFMRTYMGKRSGADPGAAWALRVGEAREVTTRDEFVLRWEPSLYAELLDFNGDASVTKGGGFNSFVVYSREYDDGGRVTSRRTGVTLAVVRDEIRLYSEDEGRRLEAPVVTYPSAVLVEEANTYQLPRADSDPAVFANEMKVGGDLDVLCVLEKDDGTWLRTPQGWLDGGAATLEEAPVFTCHGGYRQL